MVHAAGDREQLEPHVLVHQIESELYRRQGKALTNFTRTLPVPQSDLAQQIVKDVDATAAEKAFSGGKRFLAEVRKLTGDL